MISQFFAKQDILILLIVLIVLFGILVLLAFLFLKNPEWKINTIWGTILIFGAILLIFILAETLNTFTTIGFIAILIKAFIAIISINNIKYNDSDVFRNFYTNLHNIFNSNTFNYIKLLKNYLPVAILNGFLMMTAYIYTITKLRVDLSLATNCLKNNFYVEYSTIRYKVRSFAKKYDADLKKYLSILIISFAIAIFTILYIYYNNDIELYYIQLLPILLFMVIFAIMLIDKIDGNDLGKDTTSTDENDNSVYQIYTILNAILTFPLIGIISVAFLI
tara:strand:+ start:2085 stop:2915 length:831 start_codon:yes stop_codon:yes gene_type:complete